MIVNLMKPETHRDTALMSLIGRTVRVRPYYHVPSEHGLGMVSMRAKCTYRARVVEPFGADMVILEFVSDDGPWKKRGAYFPRELHRPGCKCPGCIGRGINKVRGA